jgi:hypothetical protein
MTKWWNIHTWIQHWWSRKVSFFCLRHKWEFLFWCTCKIQTIINLEKSSGKHVDRFSSMSDHEANSWLWFNSYFWDLLGWPFAWWNQLLQPIVCGLHFCSFVWQNILFNVSSDEILIEVEGNCEIVELYKIFNIFVQREWTKLRKTTSLQFRQLYWILWETNMTYEG